MTQEQEELLLKDLCARLPYGVKGLVTFNGNLFMTQVQVEDRTIDGKLYDRFAEFQGSWYDNVTIKPYLFPLSSMTEEQFEELKDFAGLKYEGNTLELVEWDSTCDKTLEFWLEEIPSYCVIKVFDWLNKNHFDYRGLIPIGLAIDATGKNIY